jgi:hypothetical protein
MNQKEESLSTRYRFCGDGLGIPGLPHEITREQADAAGVLVLLDTAIEAGAYAAQPESEA